MAPSNNPSYFIGFDVGGTFTKAVLMDGAGHRCQKAQISSQGFERKPFFARSLKDAALRLLREEGVGVPRLKAVGIGLPGPVDFGRGIILNLTNIPGWKNFRLRVYLTKYFSVPVVLENDANCMALAESRLGSARGASFALCVTLGTGVGGGLILNGSVYRGPFFMGGEIGHIPLEATGPACACGGRGCLERFVGNRAIAARVKLVFGSSGSLEEASRLAAAGDPRAKKIWKDAGTYLGRALASVANVFGPQVIVIGGGVAQAGPVLFGAIRLSMDRYLMRPLKGRIPLKRATLGNDAGMLGAALLAKEYRAES